MRQQGYQSLQINEVSMGNPALHEEPFLCWKIIQTPCVQRSPKGKNRREDFPLEVGFAAPCQLKADSEMDCSCFSNILKVIFWNIVSQGEFEAG
jgi:hypothetical protein